MPVPDGNVCLLVSASIFLQVGLTLIICCFVCKNVVDDVHWLVVFVCFVNVPFCQSTCQFHDGVSNTVFYRILPFYSELILELV